MKKMVLNNDGTINSIGYVQSYTYFAPDFIEEDFWLWQWDTIGDLNNVSSWTKSEPTTEEEEIILP